MTNKLQLRNTAISIYAEAVALEWKEGDDWLNNQAAKMAEYVIGTHVQKVWTLIRHSRYKDQKTRRHFVQETLKHYYGTDDPKQLASFERRIYEDITVVNHYAKKDFGAREVADEIYRDKGRWSNALKALSPPKEEHEPPEHTCTFICPKCGKQLHQ